MEVILLEKIGKLGGIGDRANVKAGFGRNYLLPKGFAVLATRGGEAQAASMRRSRDQRDAADRSAASDIAAKLVPAVIAVSARAKAEGDLFGSVSVNEVVAAVAAQTGIELDRHSIHIGEAIKTVGTHSVSARLHPEVQFQITVEVSPA